MAIEMLPASTPAGAVAEASGLVASLTGVLWAARTPGELVDVAAGLQGLRSAVAGVEARVLAEVDARGLARSETGWASTGEWYGHLAGLRRGVGRRVVGRARALVGERRDTLAALDAGVVSPEQAAVVLDAVGGLPGSLVLRRRGEQTLLDQARHLDATDLGRAGRHLAAVVDPDGRERREEAALAREERAAHAQRGLRVGEDGAGGVRVTGRELVKVSV